MRNHYHLLIAVGEKGLQSGMCELNRGHASLYNMRHGRVDHLFGKRYWNRHLTTEAMVQSTARYIVQNPRRAGIERGLANYAWSSYAATVGDEYPRIALAIDELLPFFGTRRRAAVAAYREFCELAPSPAELEDPTAVPGTVAEPSRTIHGSAA